MLRTIAVLFCSALLLVLAFPQTGCWPLAWVALVPYLLLIDRVNSYRAAVGWSYLFGFLFFVGTLGWFVYVTWPGAVLLLLYLSLYIALFGAAWRWLRTYSLPVRLVSLPSAWVVLEFIRAHAFTGFGWAMLAHSQYRNLWLIQVADIAGVYGVSFLVVLVNVLIFELVQARRSGAADAWPRLRPSVIAVAVVVLAVLAYGARELAAAPSLPTVRVGVVQPNIAQAIKWDPTAQPWIVQRTINLTHRLDASRLDLIVWPETSLPGVISEAPYLMDAIKITARKLQIPILIGAITDDNGAYYNSAYLVSAAGEIAARYDKIHLVPFGEYFPFRRWLSWIYKYIGLDDFTSGGAYTLMHAPRAPEAAFGVLICFEDTLGHLWRNFTRSGAGFLVNMTNDAWFQDTKEPFLHLAAAVFGCVENKRSLVRAANTGYSGFVDPWGRLLDPVADRHGKKTFVEGTSAAAVPVSRQVTVHTKYGDFFTCGCFLVILWTMGLRLFRGRSS